MNGEGLSWLAGCVLGLVFVVPSALRLRRDLRRHRVEVWKAWLSTPDPLPGELVPVVADPFWCGYGDRPSRRLYPFRYLTGRAGRRTVTA